jgi:hypothetical protein
MYTFRLFEGHNNKIMEGFRPSQLNACEYSLLGETWHIWENMEAYVHSRTMMSHCLISVFFLQKNWDVEHNNVVAQPLKVLRDRAEALVSVIP